MTLHTPNEAFPYPDTTDPFAIQPDDTGFPQQSRDLALAVQADIDSIPSYIKHRPYFKMSWNQSTTIPITTVGAVDMVFDSIEIDTAGCCDLARAPGGAYLTSGIWVVGSYYQISPLGGTGSIVQDALYTTLGSNVNIYTGSTLQKGPSLSFGQPTYDGGGTLFTHLSTNAIVYCDAQTDLTVLPSINAAYSVTPIPSSGVITIGYASLWGYWVSDM